jgi:hypothetical protein
MILLWDPIDPPLAAVGRAPGVPSCLDQRAAAGNTLRMECAASLAS